MKGHFQSCGISWYVDPIISAGLLGLSCLDSAMISLFIKSKAHITGRNNLIQGKVDNGLK
jgi:hypothetical protein